MNDQQVDYVRSLTARYGDRILLQFGYNDDPTRRGSSGGQAANAASESWKKHRDRIKAMWDARDLCTYDWIGGVIGRIALYVVGELTCRSNTGDPELDKIYDDYFHNWCGDEHDEEEGFACDITGRHRFSKLIQMAFIAMLVDGDFAFVAWVLEGIQLQCIEADRIGSPLDASQTETYIGGLTIDEITGRIRSARIYNRTRHGQYNKPVEIEPTRFIHVWDPDRVDQYRGVTALLGLLDDCRDLRETLEAEKTAIKDQSQFVGAMTSKFGRSASNDAMFDGKTVEGTPTQQARWGKWLRLAEGENVNFLTPSARPSGAFLAFMQILIRKMAIRLKLSYGFLWDLSMLGGVTARVEVRGDERQINHWQRCLIDRALRRSRRKVLDYGVAMGDLPSHPNMKVCNWHFGQRIITDMGYEVNNDMQLLKASLVAADDVAAKYSGGGNLRDVMQRNASSVLSAQQISGDTRVPIEMLAGELWPNATQLLAASNTPPQEPPPPKPGSLAAIGDKGAAQIMDLLIAVSEGRMDPDSAMHTLITVYGMHPEQAAKITPAGPTQSNLLLPPT